MSYSYTLNKITLTDAGIALLQRAIGGEELRFSSVAIGDGNPSNNFTYSGLVNEKMRVPVRKVTSYSNKTIINTFITNTSVAIAFDIHEVGIYAVDPTTSNEILYAYGYFNPATDTIPASSTLLIEEVYEIEVYTSNATNITATIDGSLVYALQSDLENLEARVENTENEIEEIQEELENLASESDLENLEERVENSETAIQNIQQTYSLITATGSQISALYDNATNIVTITLKNANGTSLANATFTVPISDTFVNCAYANGSLTLTRKDNTTKEVSISGLISDLVPNARTIAGVDLQDNITKTELLTALGINSVGNICPSGMIVMWSGTVASIPTGWRLCNGQNGTPDLRNRFIVGAGDEYAVGNTGGEKTHTLTVEEMPSHTHKYYDVSGARQSWNTAGSVYTYAIPSGAEQTQATGGGQEHENRPPYYALCFIMKI